MSFAEKQLAKFGWKSGDGLGKNRDGIKKSISVVKKNDTKGLGGKLDKWDFAWWDHVFNKSASNIQVSKDESGEVKVEKQATTTIQMSRTGIISTSRPAGPSQPDAPSPATSSTSTMSSMVPRDEYADEDEKPAPAAKSGPSWLFGFVKASASSAVAEASKRTNQEFKSSSDSFIARAGAGYDDLKAAEADEYRDYTIKVSDQELFLACEGRTARKGARAEQPGKLGRVMKELLLEDDSESSTTKKANKKKEAKEKKDKKEKDGKSSKKEKIGKSSKKDKKDKKDKKEKKEKKGDFEKFEKTKKDKKEKSASSTDKKSKKEKKIKEDMEDKEKSKKRKADESEPRTSKKSKSKDD
ncbi:G patch domain-containing protein 4 [Mortierella sp. AM989]|nr:G patch domain-containing protein 4 [Mortierella sp. AM989]